MNVKQSLQNTAVSLAARDGFQNVQVNPDRKLSVTIDCAVSRF